MERRPDSDPQPGGRPRPARPAPDCSDAVARRERRLDEMLADSFPASDPPSFAP